MDIQKLQRILEKELVREAKKHKGLPVALSGGLDSSLLACLVEPRFVITVRLPGGKKYDETKQARYVAKFLQLRQVVVQADGKDFNEATKKAVKAIGRPIPHFNVYPLWKMYEKLSELGEKEVILGDGPDESMCGYARDIAFVRAYTLYGLEAFSGYEELLNKFLPDPVVAISNMTGKPVREVKPIATRYSSPDKMIGAVNMKLMRPDMDAMSDGIAKHFGIKNIRPYQDNKKIDELMFNLPVEAKILNTQYGKHLLRLVANNYLPGDVAWRIRKVGGPVFPVGLMWKQKAEFDKARWIKYQQRILNDK